MNIGGTGRGRLLAQIASANHGLAAKVVTRVVDINPAPPTMADITSAILDLKHLAEAALLDWRACEGRAEELFQQKDFQP